MYILWSILDSLIDDVNNLKFQPGEVRLNAITKELRLLNEDDKSFYNADAIISESFLDIEVAILETTGPFLKYNKQKETQDYVKASYGLVSMLHTIGRKYEFVEFNLFKKLKLFFIQATPIKIRIWEMSLQDNNVYVLNCIGSVVVPTESGECEAKMRYMTNLFWFFKKQLNITLCTLDELKSSYLKNNTNMTRKAKGYENIHSIIKYFKLNEVIKLPNDIYLSDTDELNMHSSPFRPSSPI